MFAYAISLLSDRKLLVNVTTPCNLENFLQPNEINWLLNVPNFDNLTRKILPLDWRGEMNESGLRRINFLNYESKTDIIVVKTGLNLIKHLTVNKKHHEKLNQLGYSIDNFNIEYLVEKWYKKLFKFSPALELKYNQLLKDLKPNDNTKLICAQIRIGGEYGLKFMPRNNTKYFWDLIKDKFININTQYDYRLFITSDYPDVIDEALEEFGHDKIIGFRNNSFHINWFKDKKKSCNDIGNLILDFSILSQCDMGVISHSGYGFIGIMNREDKTSLDHFYVYTNPDIMKFKFWSRINLKFIKFSNSLLYLEFN